MKTILSFLGILTLFSGSIYGSQIPSASLVAPLTHSMSIDPKHRASDYKEVFDSLRKEKAVNKVFVKLQNGMSITNIIDMQLMANSTVFLLRYNTPNGIKVQAVELEHIQGVGYLE